MAIVIVYTTIVPNVRFIPPCDGHHTLIRLT